jgi:hypothetical protein
MRIHSRSIVSFILFSGMHQNRVDNYNTNSSRRGNGGCIRERMSRQRPSPIVPPTLSFNHFNTPPSTSNVPQSFKVEKSPFNSSHHDHNLINANNPMPQNISVTAGIYLSNIAQLDQGGMNRFKMPSPPPQMNNAAIITMPQVIVLYIVLYASCEIVIFRRPRMPSINCRELRVKTFDRIACPSGRL